MLQNVHLNLQIAAKFFNLFENYRNIIYNYDVITSMSFFQVIHAILISHYAYWITSKSIIIMLNISSAINCIYIYKLKNL